MVVSAPVIEAFGPEGLPVELTVNDTLVTSSEPDDHGRSLSAKPSISAGSPGFTPKQSASRGAAIQTDSQQWRIRAIGHPTAEGVAVTAHQPPNNQAEGKLGKLGGSMLACRHCGQAVADTADVLALDVAGYRPPELQGSAAPAQMVRLSFGICPACSDLERLAVEVVASSRARLCSPALHQVRCALVGLAVIGQALPSSVSDPLALVRHLTVASAGCLWTARFAPVLSEGARPGTCSRGRGRT